ncbi:hypothetical protein G6F57_023832 [Rhizopus arrhizus]|nr:hypothetical protein G6F57_023832 [Rhizopus arrhizus]
MQVVGVVVYGADTLVVAVAKPDADALLDLPQGVLSPLARVLLCWVARTSVMASRTDAASQLVICTWPNR